MMGAVRGTARGLWFVVVLSLFGAAVVDGANVRVSTNVALGATGTSNKAHNPVDAAENYYTPYEPDLSVHTYSTHKEIEDFYQALLKKCKKLQESTSASRKVSAATCQAETEATKKYVKDGALLGENDAKQKKESQERLLKAIDRRIAQLSSSSLASFLQRMKEKLHHTTARVNLLFKNKFLENAIYLRAATDILHRLAIISKYRFDPHHRPIKNFQSFQGMPTAFVDIDLSDHGAAASKSILSSSQREQLSSKVSTSLLDLSERINLKKKVARRVAALRAYVQEINGKEMCVACSAARKETFELYVVTLKLNTLMFKNFEKEREVLIDFHKYLNALIAKDGAGRHSKLALLKSQKARVLASIARDETFNGRRLQEHLKILERVCPMHNANAAKETKAVDELCTIVKENHSPPPPPASVGATGGNSN
jgi:hypothetical protein